MLRSFSTTQTLLSHSSRVILDDLFWSSICARVIKLPHVALNFCACVDFLTVKLYVTLNKLWNKLKAVLVTIYNTFIPTHFHYCLLLWGSVVKENHYLHLLQKTALRIISNSDYLARTEPLCKNLRIVKISDMFSVTLWKFYYKLMNNLPECFSFMNPVLPIATEL